MTFIKNKQQRTKGKSWYQQRGNQCPADQVNIIIEMYIRCRRRYIVVTLFLLGLVRTFEVSGSCQLCWTWIVIAVPNSLHTTSTFFAVRNQWGSEETRRSYTCLCSLANKTDMMCKRCISSSTLNDMDRYSIGKMTNPKWRNWWGNFLHLSSEEIDADATDDE